MIHNKVIVIVEGYEKLPYVLCLTHVVLLY